MTFCSTGLTRLLCSSDCFMGKNVTLCIDNTWLTGLKGSYWFMNNVTLCVTRLTGGLLGSSDWFVRNVTLCVTRLALNVTRFIKAVSLTRLLCHSRHSE